MHIILLGAPGTGKGTQSKIISKEYKIQQISTGDILRKNIESKNKIGKKIYNILKNGELVSDNIVCDLLYKEIKKEQYIKGFLLDGFPRTIEQAKYISSLNIKIDFIFELIVPDELIFKRISGRRIHVQSGRTYHINFNPPKEQGKDDITKEPLVIREDDTIESIKNRLENYKENHKKLNEYYLKEKKLKKLKFFQLDGTKKPDIIYNKIEKIIASKN
ncbi:adenylate kinase [Buchnera aphidicola (Aphis glycines)]|uniref:Adenylate kinase n=1 Tax=Buchnera aphidicola (Aphis glycines) TaxID=1265350 RepID=A0A0M4HB91_9GAMM|nr:adenylate kinase [Buchnera aphidicola]ALD15412.1 adenylate kinase [Buchnera aphidicola (Aphis glycines)]